MKELAVVKTEVVLGMELRVYGDIENPLFLAKDIAERIDYSRSSNGAYKVAQMLELVDDQEEKLVSKVKTSGQSRDMWFLTEDGVYSVLMKSTVDKAKEFRKGFKEFLKAWRKGAVKVVPSVDRKQELLLGLFSNDPMIVANSHKELMALEVKPLVEKIEEQTPKVEYHDAVLKADRLSTVSAIAKDLGMSAQALNKRLHEMKIQYKKGRTWMFYSEHEDKVPEYADYHISEFGQVLKFTEKGRKWIIELIENDCF